MKVVVNAYVLLTTVALSGLSMQSVALQDEAMEMVQDDDVSAIVGAEPEMDIDMDMAVDEQDDEQAGQTNATEMGAGLSSEGYQLNSTDGLEMGFELSNFERYFLKPSRFTFKHEVSSRIHSPDGLVNNRSSFRYEYSKFFFDTMYVKFDSKITAFWGGDHRADAQDTDTMTREAFVQASFGDTSIKAGIQMVVWGESEAGAITDVISPRNYSEFLLINLEDSRIGQPMIVVDQFTDGYGSWSFLYVPEAELNEYPAKGTQYDFDFFGPGAVFNDEPGDKDDSEYGLTWRKTVDRSDFSILAASVIDNDYALRGTGVNAEGNLTFDRVKQRYKMLGFTANYGTGDWLFTGEVAGKFGRGYNNGNFDLLEKDQIDASFEIEYALGAGNSVSVELVNKHISGYSADIIGNPRDSQTLVLSTFQQFLNDELTLTWLGIFNEPYTSMTNAIYVAYNISDTLSINFDTYLFDIDDERSGLYANRDQEQVVFKIAYQF